MRRTYALVTTRMFAIVLLLGSTPSFAEGAFLFHADREGMVTLFLQDPAQTIAAMLSYTPDPGTFSRINVDGTEWVHYATGNADLLILELGLTGSASVQVVSTADCDFPDQPLDCFFGGGDYVVNVNGRVTDGTDDYRFHAHANAQDDILQNIRITLKPLQ